MLSIIVKNKVTLLLILFLIYYGYRNNFYYEYGVGNVGFIFGIVSILAGLVLIIYIDIFSGVRIYSTGPSGGMSNIPLLIKVLLFSSIISAVISIVLILINVFLTLKRKKKKRIYIGDDTILDDQFD